MVNGTFLSPGPTSIFSSAVPKYASRNLTSPNFLSKGEPAVAWAYASTIIIGLMTNTAKKTSILTD